MKRYLLFILLASTQLVSFAQNALFLPFGQSNSEVVNYLHSRDYIQEVNRNNHSQIVNKVSEQRKVVYHFQDNTLYAIEDMRTFTDQKQLKEALNSCRNYMKDGKKSPKALPSKAFQKYYIVSKANQVIELTVEKAPKSQGYILNMKVTSRNHGPRMTTNGLASRHM